MENKQNERLVRQIISTIIFKSIILILFISIYFFYISSDLTLIGEKREELKTTIQNYNELKKNGPTYESLLNNITDESTKNLISKIGSDYFKNNLINDTSGDYNSYLKGKEEKIAKLKEDGIIKLRETQLSKALPSYNNTGYNEDSINDLAFINYLETLLKSFSLNTTSSIGVSDLVLYKPEGEKDDGNSLGSKIFYIPVDLSLEGTKKDILEFIYFLQNVGDINNLQNNNIIYHSDNILNKVIIGQNNNRLRNNIYENKTVSISNISFGDYLDDSTQIRSERDNTGIGFLNFIRNIDTGEKYEVTMSLKFFVRGISNLKIESYIKKIIVSYKDLSETIKTNLNLSQNIKNKSPQLQDLTNQLKNINTYLIDYEPKIKILESGLNDKNNLDNLYLLSLDNNYDLTNISGNLENIVKKLILLK